VRQSHNASTPKAILSTSLRYSAARGFPRHYKWCGARDSQRGRRSIINTASIAGLRGTPGIAGYGAAKAGVIRVTKSAAMEQGQALFRRQQEQRQRWAAICEASGRPSMRFVEPKTGGTRDTLAHGLNQLAQISLWARSILVGDGGPRGPDRTRREPALAAQWPFRWNRRARPVRFPKPRSGIGRLGAFNPRRTVASFGRVAAGC
jgi:hypothetical protein